MSSTGTIPSGKRPPLSRVLSRILTTLGVVAVAAAILALVVGAGAGAAEADTPLSTASEARLITTTLDGRVLPDWVAALLQSGRVSTAADPVLIEKHVSSMDPALGDIITYTIWLTNNSGVTVTNILLDDVLPEPVMADGLVCDECTRLIQRGLTYTQGSEVPEPQTPPPTPTSSPSDSALSPGPQNPSVPFPQPTSTPQPGAEAPVQAGRPLAAADLYGRLTEARSKQLAELTIPAAPDTAAGLGMATLGVSYAAPARASAGQRPAPATAGRVSAAASITASFTAYPLEGPAPLTVTFTNTTHATDPMTSCTWYYGDGTSPETQTSPLATFDHQYLSAGTFTVTLVVSNATESDMVAKVSYIHACEEPVASFDYLPTEGVSPLHVVFTNTSTGDFDTTAWDFGGGHTSSADVTSFDYSTPGTYPVTLTVSGCGGTDVVTHDVHACTPVDAAFSYAPTHGPRPLDVSFTNNSTGDFTISSWNFGDGVTSSATNPSHNYTTSGTFTATLTASGCGGTDVATHTVQVCEPVVADFSGSPSSGPRPLTVTFSSLSTGDLSSYSWDFGDGGTSTAENPEHTYTTAGSYNVSLTVDGCAGPNTKTRTAYIAVYEPPVASFDAHPTSGQEPLTVVFTNTSTGDWDHSLWAFGDGITSTATNPTHVYTRTGQHYAILTVDGLGGTDTTSKPINVHPMPVTAWVVERLEWDLGGLGLDLGPGEGTSVTFSMPVVGLPDGAVLRNRGFVQYNFEGSTEGHSAMSAPVDATVHAQLSTDGEAQLVAQPTWMMPAVIGVQNAQAWEDFDGDGNLDLAVTGANGPTVYRNTGDGRLELFWADASHKDLEKDIIWADLDGDYRPELVAVGSAGLGVYKYVPASSGFSLRQLLPKPSPVFWPPYGNLSSVTAGDTDGDGDVDLVAGTGVDTSTFWNPYLSRPAALYANDGTGVISPALLIDEPQAVAAWFGADTHHLGYDVAAADANNDDVADVAVGENARYQTTDMVTVCRPELVCQTHCILWWCWQDCEYQTVCEQVPAYSWQDKSWVTVGRLGPTESAGFCPSCAGWSGLGSASGPVAAGFTGPYAKDLAWGDYNGDGRLDLGVAYDNEAINSSGFYHILKNQGGATPFTAPATFNAGTGMSRALAWGDYNGDGRLEMVVGGKPPMVARWTGTGDTFSFDPLWSSLAEVAGIIGPDDVAFDMNWVDYDNDGDLDLALTSNSQPAAVFANYAPFLSPDAVFKDTWPVSSVAWGDADGDHDLDLLAGASSGEVGARLYRNVNGGFTVDRRTDFASSGFGPLDVAWGDVDGNGQLDMAVTQRTGGHTLIYTNTTLDADPAWDVNMGGAVREAAWGFHNWMPGGLDLLTAADSGVAYYPYDRSTKLPSQTASVLTTTAATSAAWGDFDGDGYLDIGAVVNGLPQVYRGQIDGSYAPVDVDTSGIQAGWHLSVTAWADYNGDGLEELAVGCNPGPILVFKYDSTTGQFALDWQSGEIRNTRGLDWGDWDNDGDLDLAVANDGQANEVYLNLTKQHGSTPLVLIWKSSESYLTTTDVAWGDMDGDGDLDLAAATTSGVRIYQNNYVQPSHLTDSFAKTMPLPNNPSYLSIARPGSTAAAYGYSSAEILPRLLTEPVAIHYTLYDPDGTRNESVNNAVGDPVLNTFYEYSLDGGGSWHTATPAASWAGQVLTTTRLGEPATFLWDAVADHAISDNARFRITIVNSSKTGFKQRATTSAVSPPFRVRGTECVWPAYPWIAANPPHPDPGQQVGFTGLVEQASGVLHFSWDFGDGSPIQTAQVGGASVRLASGEAVGLSGDWFYGQRTTHTYSETGHYTVVMTVTGEACPISRTSVVTLPLAVGTPLERKTWLPLVLR